MALEPQNANALLEEHRKTEAKPAKQAEAKKRVRRKAAAFNVCVSEAAGALPIAAHLLKKVRTEALRRAKIAETAREIDPADPAPGGDAVWAPYQIDAYWFQLEFKQDERRQYWVVLATPPDGPDDPAGSHQDEPTTATRRTNSGRARKTLGTRAKLIVYEVLVLARLLRRAVFRFVGVRLRMNLPATMKNVRPLTGAGIRHFARMVRTHVGPFRRIRVDIHSALASYRNSATRICEFSYGLVREEAWLEHQRIEQIFSVPLVFSTWVRDERPSATLWPESWFGTRDKEQAFA